MDNRRIDVTSDDIEHLRAALSIVTRSTVAGFRDYPAEDGTGRPRTLVLYWHHGPGIIGFPTPLTLDEVVPLVAKWLAELKPEEHADFLDMDGSCEPEGFRVFNEEWGHVIDNGYGIAGIQGVHAWYGK